ncbi:MAG: UvrD-helicase domain-containing protein [Succinivibrio sp.]|nr:UvrD-helicase domain-containing protein [Succinivibrio sp.]
MDRLETRPEPDFLIKDLNESQREAVCAPLGNMLIVAGAGTGKTRVLVSRICYLLKVENIPARNILAVTFTNKAADEMRERIARSTSPEVARQLWTSTFHSLCLRLLRAYAPMAGLKPGFTVIDPSNMNSLCSRIMAETHWNGQGLKPSEVASKIASLKEKGLRSDASYECGYAADPQLQPCLRTVYPLYEKICEQENLVDFPELILRTVELLRANPDLRQLQQRRFKEILVDEFQDTNTLQFELIELLSGSLSHVLVVGDDDQSIYGWRGADYHNMRRFLENYAEVRQIKLEQNYRSGQNILDLANRIIKHNSSRLVEKELHGVKGEGEKVTILKCQDQNQEAQYLALSIQYLHQEKGIPLDHIGVLYRFNHQSLLLEQELTQKRIPFCIFGGQKFYEREEIQNAIAYLRLILNSADDSALLRIINVPARKLGKKVLADLKTVVEAQGKSYLQTIADLVAQEQTASKELRTLARKLKPFYELISELKAVRGELSLPDFLKKVLKDTGLLAYYQEIDKKAALKPTDNFRAQNLEELVNNAASFAERSQEERAEAEPEEQDLLLSYISNITLTSTTELNAQGQSFAPTQMVKLMTIHAAKGLEFEAVFIVGFEQSVLPSERAVSREDGLEEERRLAYVAVTRAQDYLFISYCMFRYLFGHLNKTGISLFLKQMGKVYKNLPKEQKPYVFIDHAGY